MNVFMDRYYNYILTSSIAAWIIAQTIKITLFYICHKKFSVERLFGAGGMPSSHTAFVTSATVAVLRKAGITSVEFAIVFIIAMVVMYDAMGVRRAAGEQAKEINKINEKIKATDNKHSNPIMQFKHMKESLGHTPLEVFAGAVLGVLVAMVVPIK